MFFGNLGKNNIYNFLIWFLLTLSAITFTGLIRTIYHLYYTNYNDAKKGEIGDKGKRGLKGNNANTSITNIDLCIQQMTNETNKAILKKLKKFDTNENYFNNIYLKENYERICNKYL